MFLCSESLARTGAVPCEVWLHEDCVVWADSVTLVGPVIRGLDEALEVAAKTVRKKELKATLKHCKNIKQTSSCCFKLL